MSDGWFPRYSPSGQMLMRGSKVLTVQGTTSGVLNTDGISGAWLTEDTLLYRKHSDGALVMQNVPLDEVTIIAPHVTHVDARDGRYVYAMTDPVCVFNSAAQMWIGFGGGDSGCAIDRHGNVVLLRHEDGSVWFAGVNRIPMHQIAPLGANVRACGDVFVWRAGERIQGYRDGVVVDLTVDAPEFWPVPFLVNGEYWVLTYTQTRCLLRPWGESRGIVVAEGETFYPDAVWDRTRIRVAWSDGKGDPVEALFVPFPMTELKPPPAPTYVDSPAGTLVPNLWRFLVGQTGRSWVRTDALTHSIPMSCYVDANSAFYVKFRNPNAWERWARRDDGWIYHVEDHSGHSMGGAETYQFSDSRWLRADMAVGEEIVCGQNHLRELTAGVWQAWKFYPYRMRLTRHRVWSNGLEEITFVYDPGGNEDTYEVYACRSDIGWWRWQEIDQKTDALRNQSSWDAPCDESVLMPINVRVPWPDNRPIQVTPVAPPQEDPVKSREQFYNEFKQVNEFYKAEDGLQRPGGMVLGDGTCDAEAMGAWGYALLAEDKSVAYVKHQIVRSQEWRDKHAGEEPPSFL